MPNFAGRQAGDRRTILAPLTHARSYTATTLRELSLGLHPWSIFNEQRWSVFNKRQQGTARYAKKKLLAQNAKLKADLAACKAQVKVKDAQLKETTAKLKAAITAAAHPSPAVKKAARKAAKIQGLLPASQSTLANCG